MNTDKNKSYIAKLIFKSINGLISKNENKALHEWFENHPEDFKIYQKYSSGVNVDNIYDFYKQMNKNKGQKKINIRINQIKRKYLISKLSIAASVISFIIISFLSINDLKEKSVYSKISVDTNCPLLITENGKKHNLICNNNDSIHLNNEEVIIQEGKKLIYKNTSGKNNVNKYNTIKIPEGSYYYLILEDKTTVWLNASSTLKFPTKFKNNKREVFLSGEAFFNVSKNKKAPFIVNCKNHKVKVLGTKFNICAYKDDDKIITSLEKGRVDIISNKQTIAQLYPSDQSIYNIRSKKISVSKVNVKHTKAWLHNYWYFDKESIESIMKKLSRWYGIEYFYQNENISNDIIVGRFKRTRDINEILKNIEKISNVRFDINKKTVIIKSQL